MFFRAPCPVILNRVFVRRIGCRKDYDKDTLSVGWLQVPSGCTVVFDEAAMEEGEICSAGNQSSTHPPPTMTPETSNPEKTKQTLSAGNQYSHLSSAAEHIAVRRV